MSESSLPLQEEDRVPFDFGHFLIEDKDSFKEDSEKDQKLLRECFDHYAKDFEVPALDFDRFTNFLNDLLVDEAGQPHYIPQQYLGDLFRKFGNENSLIDWTSFQQMWPEWLRTVLRPRSALLIIDVQNDFISGSLALLRCPAGHRGEEVVPVINRMLKEIPFDLVVYSYDWHPPDHISFHDNAMQRKIIERNGLPVQTEEDLAGLQVFETVTFEGPPKTEQKLWPRHCVQGSWGARLHDEMLDRAGREYINVYKGTKSLIDSYSAFWDNGKLSETVLNQELRKRKITDVYVVGLAQDICVAFTSLHANEYGYRTVMINDACRGVDIQDIAKMKDKLINGSGLIVDSDQVAALVMGLDRCPEHARQLAKFT